MNSELCAIIDDLTLVLEEDPSSLAYAYEGEPSPETLEMPFRPPPKHPDPETPKARPAAKRELTVNARCTMCSHRMYPVKRHLLPGRIPVLVLHYNGSVFENEAKRDRSDRFVFGDASADALFGRMFAKAGWSFEDFHYQEFPACHFNAARSLPQDWNERGKNCLSIVSGTVKAHGIRLLALTGAAAILLLGDEMARKMAVSGEISTMDLLEGSSLPFLVLRSPAALLALEKRRTALKGDREKYARVLAEEKAVKLAILETLGRAKTFLDTGRLPGEGDV